MDMQVTFYILHQHQQHIHKIYVIVVYVGVTQRRRERERVITIYKKMIIKMENAAHNAQGTCTCAQCTLYKIYMEYVERQTEFSCLNS